MSSLFSISSVALGAQKGFPAALTLGTKSPTLPWKPPTLGETVLSTGMLYLEILRLRDAVRTNFKTYTAIVKLAYPQDG